MNDGIDGGIPAEAQGDERDGGGAETGGARQDAGAAEEIPEELLPGEWRFGNGCGGSEQVDVIAPGTAAIAVEVQRFDLGGGKIFELQLANGK